MSDGADRSDRTFDDLVSPVTSVEGVRQQRPSLAAMTAAVTWGVAAIVAVFTAAGGLLVSLGLSEARSFGWPTSAPTDRTAQMNRDEALLALPVGGTLTVLIVTAYIASMIYIKRDRGTVAWLAPSALVVGAPVAPIALAFTL